jgi:hypothetical protein
MYACYTRTRVEGNATRYQLRQDGKDISIFGCNEGFVPWPLGFEIPRGQNEPYLWHVNVLAELDAQPNYGSSTLIMDLKPKQTKNNASPYELLDVWGYSADGWTPALLRLNGLFVVESPENVNRKDFTHSDNIIDGPYEFLYLTGSVKDGKIIGTWAPSSIPSFFAVGHLQP